MEQKETVRINKYLAMSGVCSRRDADKLLEQGKVTINGRVAGMGDRVGEGDTVCVGKKRIGGAEKKVVLAFYKPTGIVCTERDKHAEKMISDLIKYPIRVTYAGRLDKESEGLLILTNDGDLIQKMMKASEKHEKEYIVKTDKEIPEEFLLEMSKGVYLKELDITTRPCEIEKIGKFTFRIVLTQGVNRQIRRMCKAFGFEVLSLKRIRIMNIMLGDLKYGQYRELSEEELFVLYKLCGLNR